MDLPKYPHCAIFCGQTGCGKTEFVLDLLEEEYRGVYKILLYSDLLYNGTRRIKIVNG